MVGTSDALPYACQACAAPLASHGMCPQCSRAWGLGRIDGLTSAGELLAWWANDLAKTDSSKSRAIFEAVHRIIEKRGSLSESTPPAGGTQK